MWLTILSPIQKVGSLFHNLTSRKTIKRVAPPDYEFDEPKFSLRSIKVSAVGYFEAKEMAAEAMPGWIPVRAFQSQFCRTWSVNMIRRRLTDT